MFKSYFPFSQMSSNRASPRTRMGPQNSQRKNEQSQLAKQRPNSAGYADKSKQDTHKTKANYKIFIPTCASQSQNNINAHRQVTTCSDSGVSTLHKVIELHSSHLIYCCSRDRKNVKNSLLFPLLRNRRLHRDLPHPLVHLNYWRERGAQRLSICQVHTTRISFMFPFSAHTRIFQQSVKQ